MKKFLFIITSLALFTITASAQFFVNGSLSINSSKASVSGNEVSTSGFSFTPKVGYSVSKVFEAGVGINILSDLQKTKSRDNRGREQTISNKESEFSLALFGRYKFAGKKKIGVWGHAEASIGSLTIDGTAHTCFGFSVVPMISYKLSKKLSAELYLDMLSLSFASSGTTTSVFSVNAISNYSINDLWTNFCQSRLGVSYWF